MATKLSRLSTYENLRVCIELNFAGLTGAHYELISTQLKEMESVRCTIGCTELGIDQF